MKDDKKKKPEDMSANKGEPEEKDKPKKYALIDSANKAAERLEKANKDMKELLDRQEKLMGEARLAGKSYSSQSKKPEKDPLDDPKNYANAVMNGEVNPLEIKKT